MNFCPVKMEQKQERCECEICDPRYDFYADAGFDATASDGWDLSLPDPWDPDAVQKGWETNDNPKFEPKEIIRTSEKPYWQSARHYKAPVLIPDTEYDAAKEKRFEQTYHNKKRRNNRVDTYEEALDQHRHTDLIKILEKDSEVSDEIMHRIIKECILARPRRMYACTIAYWLLRLNKKLKSLPDSVEIANLCAGVINECNSWQFHRHCDRGVYLHIPFEFRENNEHIMQNYDRYACSHTEYSYKKDLTSIEHLYCSKEHFMMPHRTFHFEFFDYYNKKYSPYILIPKCAKDDWMRTDYKKVPNMSDVMTEKRIKLAKDIWNLHQVEWKDINYIYDLTDLIKQLRKWLGNPEKDKVIIKKRNHKRKKNTKDIKNTYTYTYKRSNNVSAEFKKDTKMKNDALKLLGILEGRYQNFSKPSVKQLLEPIERTNLVSMIATDDEIKKDYLTSLIVGLIVAEIAYTTTCVKESKYPTHIKQLIEKLKTYRGTNWFLLGSILPYSDILSHVEKTNVEKMLKITLDLLNCAGDFLETPYNNGVKECIESDIPEERMIAKPSVDIEGWNKVANGFCNLLGLYRCLCFELDIEPIPIFRCMSLTSKDTWLLNKIEELKKRSDAGCTDKDFVKKYEMYTIQEKNKEAFRLLSIANIKPWSALSLDNTKRLKDMIEMIIKGSGCKSSAWFGLSKEREKEMASYDLGDKTELSKEIADELKNIEAFNWYCLLL